MFGTKAKDPLDAQRVELASAEKELVRLGEERQAARALDATSRNAHYSARNAPGLGAFRASAVADAERAAVQAAERLEAADSAYTTKRDAVEALRAALADAEQAQQAARSESDLRNELGDVRAALESAEKDRLGLIRKRAGGGLFGVGPLSTDERRNVNEKLQHIVLDMRKLFARRDELEGLIDRKQRGWQLPTPIGVPSLPDPRLLLDEQVTALEDLLSRIKTRLDTAHARRLAAEQALDDLEMRRDATISQGVQQARFHDLTAEKKAAWEAIDQLEERAYYARLALAEAQGRPVARAV